MAKRTALQKIIIAAIGIWIIQSCANQLPPSGGDVDRIPPEIIEIYPPDRTVNFAENFIEITFTEYVNKRSVQEAIFISPNIAGNIEYNWSGKTLEIELPDSLLPKTTYTITIGTDVEDLNNKNKMENAFAFAFSTGDKIDNGTITGTVLDKDAAGVMIYAYKSSENDSLKPSNQKPNYITQTGTNGSFRLTGLAEGEYLVLAVRDQFKDFIYDSGQDEFGIPYTKVFLSSSDSLFQNLNFQLQVEDTTKPRVYGLTMTDDHHILIEFSEGIDSTKISNENFVIYDSTKQQKINVDYFFKGNSKQKNYLIAFKDTLPESENLNLISKNIFDQSGNALAMEVTSFIRNVNPDTTHPELIKFEEQYPNKMIDFIDGFVSFSYTDGFSFSELNKAIKVVDKMNENVEYSLHKIDDSSFRLQFNKLKPNANYDINLEQGYFIDAAGNLLDSVFTYKFSTINNLEFSGISGEIVGGNDLNIMVHARNITDDKLNYLQNKRRFNFERVFPGKYLLIVFDDANKNGIYDDGSIQPLVESERFIFYSDTLELKPRWPVGDIKVIFE